MSFILLSYGDSLIYWHGGSVIERVFSHFQNGLYYVLGPDSDQPYCWVNPRHVMQIIKKP